MGLSPESLCEKISTKISFKKNLISNMTKRNRLLLGTLKTRNQFKSNRQETQSIRSDGQPR